MKKIFIVILFPILITGLFADKITYEKNSIFGKKTYYMNYVKFDGISKGEVYFTYTVAQSSTNDPVVLGTIKNFGYIYQESYRKLPLRCEQVVSIEDDFGNPIEFDCYSNEMTPAISKITKSNNGATRLGGILIMAGSGLLYANLEKDCSECDLEELQSFSDDSLARQKIAFLLLGFGGFLIAMGG